MVLVMSNSCIQDTLSSRARLDERAREQRYLAYKSNTEGWICLIAE